MNMDADSRFVFGVDIDGVVSDFYAGIRPLAAEWLGVEENTLIENVSYGLPEWRLDRAGGLPSEKAYEKFHRWAVVERNLFQILKPFPQAPLVLRRLAHVYDVRIRIITHRLYVKHFHKEAIMQTTEWLNSHNIPYYDLCFMKEKAAVGACLYIEDSPTNIERLRKSGCKVIVYSNSTNLELDPPRAHNWGEVEALVTAYQ
jgi:5'(3')-deoxyribonucleotidase